ncbi:MAG: LytTR family DNA-binding domain-containing protein [Bacteroidota bacterium]
MNTFSLKTYVVEDEARAVALLDTYIQRIDFLDLVGTARNPLKAFAFLQENTVDVLFLDINMPILSGIELFQSLVHPPKVIFTTAYPEYAVEGFNLAAVDYLLKPISFPRFVQACERLRPAVENAPTTSNSALFLADIVYVKSGTTTHKLSWKEVFFLEKDENYVIYHTEQGRILSRQTLSDLAEIFPQYIVRIHKSYAVSLLHLSKVEREFVWIAERSLPIGRTYKTQLMERISKI